MSAYVLVRVLDNAGLVVLTHPRWGQQVWSIAKLRRRRRDKCALCGGDLGTHALRPVSNASNRMERICMGHLQTGVW